MNIFVLDPNPQVAARMMCDKHVVKMIIETAQMLCTVAHSRGHHAPYRATHSKHPCTVWTGESKGNWDWLIHHGMALCSEYTERYGRVHKSQAVMEWCRDNPIGPTSGIRTPFRQAMPAEYKQPNPIEAYRAYYRGAKAGFAEWRHGPTPEWWKEGEDDSI